MLVGSSIAALYLLGVHLWPVEFFRISGGAFGCGARGAEAVCRSSTRRCKRPPTEAQARGGARCLRATPRQSPIGVGSNRRPSCFWRCPPARCGDRRSASFRSHEDGEAVEHVRLRTADESPRLEVTGDAVRGAISRMPDEIYDLRRDRRRHQRHRHCGRCCGARLEVLLAEAEDLAGATSSASSKLIHGGLRYLEHFEFRLVREALAEREVLLAKAPHIIWPMRFILPHIAGMRRERCCARGFFFTTIWRRERR